MEPASQARVGPMRRGLAAQDQPEPEGEADDGAERHADGEAAHGGRAFEGAVYLREDGGEEEAQARRAGHSSHDAGEKGEQPSHRFSAGSR